MTRMPNTVSDRIDTLLGHRFWRTTAWAAILAAAVYGGLVVWAAATLGGN